MRCDICGINTIFFVWSSCRRFPIDRYIKEKGLKLKGDIFRAKRNGHPVCFCCLNKLKKE